MENKIIVLALDEQGKYVTQEELDIIRSFWKEYHPMRLCIELGAFVGLRAADIVNLKVPGHSQFEGFSEDFRTLRYIVSKPSVKKDRIKHKIKERQIPSWLADKLFLYFKNNLYIFKGNRLFPFSTKYIWDEIKKMRDRNCDKHPWLKEAYQVIQYKSGRIQKLYRIAFHTLRAYWITNHYQACGDLVKTARTIGHTKIDTCMKYIRFPNLKEDERGIAETIFNLPNQPKHYVSKDQSKLSEWGAKQPHYDSSTQPIMINGFYIIKCKTCSKIFHSKSKKRKYCSNCSETFKKSS